jgi:hypothetical protein
MRAASQGCALVTGASGGIGSALASALAEGGWEVVITGRSGAALEGLRSLHPHCKIHVVRSDLGSSDGSRSILEFLDREGLEVELLVNNAGFGLLGEFTELGIDRQLEMVAVNISSLLQLTHRLARRMIERGRGRILNVASTAATAPGPLMAVYYATKAFDYSFSVALGEELRESGITVSTLCPGATHSGFDRAAGVTRERPGRRHTMSAREVARVGLKGLFAGRPVIVPGNTNRIAVAVARLLPRSLVVSFLHRFNAAKRGGL